MCHNLSVTHGAETPGNRTSVLVLGGGVAGIAAATALADAGLAVQLLEKRPLLGGRSSSHVDRETGERVDDVQHGTMRCCTNLDALLSRLGVADQIVYSSKLEFQDARGRRSTLSGSRLPAPLHTLPSFLAFRALGAWDKLAIAKALASILRAGKNGGADHETMAHWLSRQRQPERAVRRFWRPILVSACNEEPDAISARTGFMLFREAFLATNVGYQFGVPRIPLGELYSGPARQFLGERGGCARAPATVRRIEVAAGKVAGVHLADGEVLQAAWYVSALPFQEVLRLLPSDLLQASAYWREIRNLESVPILGVHVWLDRAVRCPAALALLDRKTEWVFNKGVHYGWPREAPAYLSMVISASRRYSGMRQEEILQQVMEEVREALPDARDAAVLRWQVVQWPRATFSPGPGVDASRPDQQSPIPNLMVAGEWTHTGWPSTMESAARSGHLAAEKLLAQLGRPASRLAPDLPHSWLAALLQRSSSHAGNLR